MNPKRLVFVLITLFGVALGQQPSPSPRERNPNSTLTIHGGSGSEVLQQCQAALKVAGVPKTPKASSMKDVVDGTYCQGYVFGVVDTLIGLSLQAPTTYCIPTKIENDRLIRIVVKSLKDHPDTLQYPAAALVTKAIREAFPCK